MKSAERSYLLGIDIGGTKLAAGIVTPSGEVLHAERTPCLAAEGPQSVIARLVGLCRRTVERSGIPWSEVAAGGISCPGPLDQLAGVVKSPPNLPGWVDLPLIRVLRDALGIPFCLEKDTNAAALGEHRLGAGRGAANMVYVTVSTGVGGGVIINNQLYRGETGKAGEIGHLSVVYNGRPCNCGSRGCLEAYASGTGIALRAQEALAAGQHSLMLDLAGSIPDVTSETVAEAVRRGDSLAAAIWDETTEMLGAGLASVVHAFNPRRIVLGGGVTKAGDLLLEPVRRHALRRIMPPLLEHLEILPALLGDQSGIVGAAIMARELK